MIIEIAAGLRLRRPDPNNWVLEAMVHGEWVGVGGYYGTIESAVHALLQRHLSYLTPESQVNIENLRGLLEEMTVNLTYLLQQIEKAQTPLDPLSLLGRAVRRRSSLRLDKMSGSCHTP